MKRKNGLPVSPFYTFPLPLVRHCDERECIIKIPLMTLDEFEFFKQQLEAYRDAFVIQDYLPCENESSDIIDENGASLVKGRIEPSDEWGAAADTESQGQTSEPCHADTDSPATPYDEQCGELCTGSETRALAMARGVR